MRTERPQIIYISYDGAAEPLGQSQVVAYLERLAVDCDIQLISFEKPDDQRESIGVRLAAGTVDWHPLTYHRRPPVASTALDVLRGTRLIRKLAARIEGPLIVHARSYVPALMALRAKLGERARFLFDIRGFWADERVEGGMWRRQGAVYPLAKRYGASVLRRGRRGSHLDTQLGRSDPSLDGLERCHDRVIPTCVDVDTYLGARSEAIDPPGWCGRAPSAAGTTSRPGSLSPARSGCR